MPILYNIVISSINIKKLRRSALVKWENNKLYIFVCLILEISFNL